MSERRAACSTRIAKKHEQRGRTRPPSPMRRAKSTRRPSANSSTTMAKPAGFQMCLPSTRSTNFEPIAMTPASACSHGSSARSSRLSDSPVISGERRSKTRQPEPARAQRLRDQRGADSERAVERLRTEIDPAEIEDKQSSERRDLIVAGIRPQCSRQQIGHRHPGGFRDGCLRNATRSASSMVA